MTNFNFEKVNNLNDAVVITPFFNGDERGSFEKIFENNIFESNNIHFSIRESFTSISQKNVIRGMHFQYNKPQAKIVTVLNGACYDVLLDLRKNSTTYMNYVFFSLNDTNHNILFVPKGFAHGFLSLTNDMCMLYYCDETYDKESDTGIIFNDKTLNIKWPIFDVGETIHSARDMSLMTFDEFKDKKLFLDL